MRSFNLASGTSQDKRIALNRCCQCGYEWRDQPFGLARHDACPKCRSVYWQWLDYAPRD